MPAMTLASTLCSARTQTSKIKSCTELNTKSSTWPNDTVMDLHYDGPLVRMSNYSGKSLSIKLKIVGYSLRDEIIPYSGSHGYRIDVLTKKCLIFRPIRNPSRSTAEIMEIRSDEEAEAIKYQDEDEEHDKIRTTASK